MSVGRRPGYQYYFPGLIDELAMYNRALSPSEIMAIYQVGGGGRCALVGVDRPGSMPRSFDFSPLWPNPGQQVTHIEFQLPTRAQVVAEVLDVAGRHVATLEDRILDAGSHQLEWDERDASGRRAAAGVYFVRISVGHAALTRRVVLIQGP